MQGLLYFHRGTGIPATDMAEYDPKCRRLLLQSPDMTSQVNDRLKNDAKKYDAEKTKSV